MAQPFEDIKSPGFHISKKWLPLYETLCLRGRTRDTSYYLFERYTQLYTLCASIGYRREELFELKDIHTPFTLEQVSEKYEWLPLQAMAWDWEKGDLTLLADSKRVIKLCDQFAEAGMSYLVKEYFNEFMDEDNHLLSPGKKEIEFNLANILEMLNEDILSI